MAGEQQDRYTLQKKLGAGAMGEVWLATDTLLNRPVAIKYLKSTQDDEDAKKFFLSEAQALASLNHPNITLIYDAVFDEAQNQFHLLMEYVEGESLSEFISTQSELLPLKIILDIAIGMLRALQYAHNRGIVHRDIKPANVMLQDDTVKLTDFGVAGLMSRLVQGSEYMVGSPIYIPPEQIEGMSTDGRADLYSLGIMLYEMICGRIPYSYTTEDELFEAHLSVAPYPLSQFAPDVPLALEHTIMRLLAKNPDDRYPSAGVVLDTLTSIQARRKFSQSNLQLLDPGAKPLVGRTTELQQIETVWGQCQQHGSPHLVVVQGGMGMGKNRLIAEFVGTSIIDTGLVAVVGRSEEHGTPYAPFGEVIATIFKKGLTKSPANQKQIDQLLEHIPSLGRLLDIPDLPSPETKTKTKPTPTSRTDSGLWQILGQRVPEATVKDSNQAQWQFFATALSTLNELGPTVIFLEDAHFLDKASVELVSHLLRQKRLPLLLIAACRTLPAWLNSIATEEKTMITLLPLSTPEVQNYLTHLLEGEVPIEIARLVRKQSQGIPFHIKETSEQWIDSKELYQTESGRWRYTPPKKTKSELDALLPKSLLKAFTRRLNKLPDASRDALAQAALIEPGPNFNFKTWLLLLGGESQADFARTVLTEALKLRLVRQVDDNRYTFHPVDVDKSLRDALPEARLRELHRQAAQLLYQKRADPIQVAYHYEQAGLAIEAARYLEAAGARAVSNNSLKAALTYYKRAVELVESQAAYKALGLLYRQYGKRVESIQALKQALDLAEQAHDTSDLAQILNELSLTLWLYDRYKDAYQYAANVLKLSGVTEDQQAIAYSHLGTISWLGGRLEEAENWCQKSVDLLQTGENEVRLASTYNRIGQIYLSQGKLGQAQTIFTRSLELRRKTGDYWGQGDSLANLSKVITEQGDFEQAKTLLASAQQLFNKVDSQAGLMTVSINRGRVMLYQQRPEKALRLLTKSMRLALEMGKRSAYTLSEIYLLNAQASLARNHLDRAQAAASDALKLVEAIGNREHVALARTVMAQIYATQGNIALAEPTFKKALALCEQVGNQAGLVRAQLSYAQLLSQQDHPNQAATLEQTARAEAEKMGLYLGADWRLSTDS